MQKDTQRNTRRDLLNLSLVTLAVLGIFIAYLLLIGIPKTEARNLYNKAELSISQGEIQVGKDLLNEAYSFWPEAYILNKLNSLEQ